MATTDAHPLFAGLIDYAGLFPPARLDMAEAVAGYRAARDGNDGHVVDRFVVPAARLAELAGALDAAPVAGETPWPLSILVDGEWPGLGDGVAIASAGLARHGPRVVAGVAEVRIPPTALGDPLEAAIATATDALSPLVTRSFFEVPLASSWPPAMRSAVAAIAGAGAVRGGAAGAKLRTGGLDPTLFPTPGQVAEFIMACTEAGISFKCTAGLHHPLRHDDPETGLTHHGFLNVLAASLLARQGASFAELTEVLSSRQLDITLSSGTFSWGRWHLDATAVAAARAGGFVAFGSCSFDEPVAGLRALGAL